MLDNNVFLGELTRKELGEAISSGTIKGGNCPNGCHRTASRPSGDDPRYRQCHRNRQTRCDKLLSPCASYAHRSYVGVRAPHGSGRCVDDTAGDPS